MVQRNKIFIPIVFLGVFLLLLLTTVLAWNLSYGLTDSYSIPRGVFNEWRNYNSVFYAAAFVVSFAFTFSALWYSSRIHSDKERTYIKKISVSVLLLLIEIVIISLISVVAGYNWFWYDFRVGFVWQYLLYMNFTWFMSVAVVVVFVIINPKRIW